MGTGPVEFWIILFNAWLSTLPWVNFLCLGLLFKYERIFVCACFAHLSKRHLISTKYPYIITNITRPLFLIVQTFFPATCFLGFLSMLSKCIELSLSMHHLFPKMYFTAAFVFCRLQGQNQKDLGSIKNTEKLIFFPVSFTDLNIQNLFACLP